MVRSRFLALISLVLGFSLVGVSSAEFPSGLGEVTGKVVWVDFWASWCVPCRRSFPWMNRMREEYESAGLQIIGVNVDKERELAAGFLAETPASFDLVYDPEGRLAERFGVQAMPSSFLLDADGNVIEEHYGFRLDESETYEAGIRQALAAAGRATNN